MSEADVIRQDLEFLNGKSVPFFGGSTIDVSRSLASLDSLTTRLAEVERERDELELALSEAHEYEASLVEPEVKALKAELDKVRAAWQQQTADWAMKRAQWRKREKADAALVEDFRQQMQEARFGRDKVNLMLDDAEASERSLREQLTQAREALENLTWAAVNHYGPDIRGSEDDLREATIVARQALATINEGDKHDWMVVGPHQAVQQAQCQRCGVMRTHRNRDEACPGVVRPLPVPPGYAATINREGDGSLWDKVGGPGQPRVATINREGETEA